MKKNSGVSSNLKKIQSFILETEITVLVIIPPIIGFGGFFVYLFIMELITQGATSQAAFEIGLGLACAIECFAGIAQIYKQEMPGPFGKRYKGKFAVISGIIIVLIFGLSSIFTFISGFAELFSN